VPGAGPHALLTRAPLRPQANPRSPFDLHVLGAPPAFVLSQDQTLSLSPRPQRERAYPAHGITLPRSPPRPKRRPKDLKDPGPRPAKGPPQRRQARARRRLAPPGRQALPKGTLEPAHRRQSNPKLAPPPQKMPEPKRPQKAAAHASLPYPHHLVKEHGTTGSKLPAQTQVRGTSGSDSTARGREPRSRGPRM
jgi:hypothetical protein